jgi:isocitrate lyase
MLWFETSEPDLEQASQFAKAIQETFPNKLLAYNCSSSFNWRLKLSPDTISSFQQRLGEMGYKFQFITLAGWHLVNYFTFDLAKYISLLNTKPIINSNGRKYVTVYSNLLESTKRKE